MRATGTSRATSAGSTCWPMRQKKARRGRSCGRASTTAAAGASSCPSWGTTRGRWTILCSEQSCFGASAGPGMSPPTVSVASRRSARVLNPDSPTASRRRGCCKELTQNPLSVLELALLSHRSQQVGMLRIGVELACDNFLFKNTRLPLNKRALRVYNLTSVAARGCDGSQCAKKGGVFLRQLANDLLAIV